MEKILEFPFKNYLDHKMETITDQMVGAVINAQKNHIFFNRVALLARDIFMHRWDRGELLYPEMIKVFVGLGNTDSVHFNIDESSRPPEHVVAVPLGYLGVIHELSGISIPCAVNLDFASNDPETARGLGYWWVHTDTMELLDEIYVIWKQVIAGRDAYNYITKNYADFVNNTIGYTAELCEVALVSLRTKQIKKERQCLILTALHALNQYSENHLGICEIFVKDEPNQLAEDHADDFKKFGVSELFSWICDNLSYPNLYGNYEDFLEHLQELLTDDDFEKEFPDALSKLIEIFVYSEILN